MIDIEEFAVPKCHPFGLLTGYEHAHEKEELLTLILHQCIQAKGFVPITTNFDHPAMVQDGLLTEIDNCTYTLTKKAIGLLYSVYYKNEE